MYVVARQSQLGDLGISLTPPRWLRDLGNAVLRQVRVVVQTPVGPITVDPSNPDSMRRVQDILRSAQIQIGQPPPGPIQQVSNAVGAIPGGWLTIGALGLGLVLLLRRS